MSTRIRWSVVFVFVSLLIVGLFGILKADISTKVMTAGRDYCDVEVRAGKNLNAYDNPVVYRGSVQAGRKFVTQETFLDVQRESNPGVCNSGRGPWNRCSWENCSF